MRRSINRWLVISISLSVYFFPGLEKQDNMSGEQQFNNNFFYDHRIGVWRILSINDGGVEILLIRKFGNLPAGRQVWRFGNEERNSLKL